MELTSPQAVVTARGSSRDLADEDPATVAYLAQGMQRRCRCDDFVTGRSLRAFAEVLEVVDRA